MNTFKQFLRNPKTKLLAQILCVFFIISDCVRWNMTGQVTSLPFQLLNIVAFMFLIISINTKE